LYRYRLGVLRPERNQGEQGSRDDGVKPRSVLLAGLGHEIIYDDGSKIVTFNRLA
jgi:hypothetical protein